MSYTCNQRVRGDMLCGKPAVAIMRWLGAETDLYVCEEHKRRGCAIGQAMGFTVHFDELPRTEDSSVQEQTSYEENSMKRRLNPIRTKDQCFRAGDSLIPFRGHCLPHMPFLRRLRVAWMVVRGVDLSQYDIDCGRHRIDQVPIHPEVPESVLQAL